MLHSLQGQCPLNTRHYFFQNALRPSLQKQISVASVPTLGIVLGHVSLFFWNFPVVIQSRVLIRKVSNGFCLRTFDQWYHLLKRRALFQSTLSSSCFWKRIKKEELLVWYFATLSACLSPIVCLSLTNYSCFVKETNVANYGVLFRSHSTARFALWTNLHFRQPCSGWPPWTPIIVSTDQPHFHVLYFNTRQEISASESGIKEVSTRRRQPFLPWTKNDEICHEQNKDFPSWLAPEVLDNSVP